MTDKTILCVGNTVLENFRLNEEAAWQIQIGGGAAIAALASAFFERKFLRVANIALATSSGADCEFSIQKDVRDLFTDGGVEVFSHPDARPGINVWLKPGFDKFSRDVKTFRSTIPFDPLSIAKDKSLSPDAALFMGASMVYDDHGYLTALARQLKAKGCVNICDPTPRRGQSLSVETCHRLGSVADIIKVSHQEVSDGGFPSTDPQEVAGVFLDGGAKFVFYSEGGIGCTVFYRFKGATSSHHASSAVNLKLPMAMGGGDAFCAALARYCVKHGITSQNIGQHLTQDTGAEMAISANFLAACFLGERNKFQDAIEPLRPIAVGTSPQEIVHQIYPKYEFSMK